jgi:hypothetical protein
MAIIPDVGSLDEVLRGQLTLGYEEWFHSE